MDCCYTLECDGPIACHVYDILQHMKTALFKDVHLHERCEAFAGACQTLQEPMQGTAEGWRNITRASLLPAQEYYTTVIEGKLRAMCIFFAACRCFNPFKLREHFVTGSDLDGLKQHPAFAPGGCHHGLFRDMQGELPKYRQLVKNIKGTRDVVQFFKLNGSTIPAFAEAFKIANLVRSSSAAVERLFSMLRRHFNDQQSSMLGDHIEGAMLISYNHRNSSPKRVIVGEPGKWLY